MTSFKLTFVTFAFLSMLIALAGEAKQPRIESSQKQVKVYQYDTPGKQRSYESDMHQNEIDDRIIVAEPYKSILQTTTRFALSQTKIPNHINLDTAMNLINNAGYMLSKPATLFKAVKVIAVTIASILAATFFFPGAYQYAEVFWQDPLNALNLEKFLNNGISEKSVIGVLSLHTDETLSKFGLNDHSCRQRSLCYLGEVLKCSFPDSSDAITKFASNNFSNVGYKDNKYFKAFAAGFVDQNCTRVGTSDSGESPVPNCLGNFFTSAFLSPYNSRQKEKFQTIQATRA